MILQLECCKQAKVHSMSKCDKQQTGSAGVASGTEFSASQVLWMSSQLLVFHVMVICEWQCFEQCVESICATLLSLGAYTETVLEKVKASI